MINIEQSTLSPFEHNIPAFTAIGMQKTGNIGNHRPDSLCHLQSLFQYLLKVDNIGLEVILQDEIVVIEDLAKAGRKSLAVQHIPHLQATTGDLVLISRSDTSTGGTDRLLATSPLTRLIKRYVIRQNEGAGFTNFQSLAGRNAALFQHIELLEQRLGGEHHTITDETLDTLMQNPGRDQVQNRLLAIYYQGMPCIVPALKANHGMDLLGKKVNHLALALITPLGADNDNVLAHIHALCSDAGQPITGLQAGAGV